MTIKSVLCAGWGILLAASLFAQKQAALPQQVQQHLSQKAPQLLAQLNRLMPALEENSVENRGGNTLRLDSTVLFSNYSANDSFPMTKSVFRYPTSHTTEQTDYDNLGGWQPVSRSTQKTDALGRTTEASGETYDTDSEAWVPASQLKNYPHGNSLTQVDSFVLNVWDETTASWTLALRNVTSFDDQDRPVAYFTQFTQFLGQDLSLLDELSYDAKGDNYLTLQSIEQQGIWTPFARIETEFEQHRDTLSITYTVVDSTTSFPQDKTETDYTPDGKTGVVRTSSWDFAASDWVPTHTTAYLYNNDGNVSSLVNDTPDPQNPIRDWTESIYLDADNLDFETYRTWDFATSAWVLQDRTFYYYSTTTASGEVVNAGPLPLSPNPTPGPVRLPATDHATLRVLNAQGALVTPAQVRLNDGQIDLGNLPAGVYYISVQQGNVRQTGTVVKQ